MKKSVFLLVAFYFVTAAPTALFAQFEGKIKYATFDVEDGVPESDDEFTVYFASNRIFLEGDRAYDVRDFKTEGILIRMDMEDVVFFTGDDAALKVTKADVDAIKQLFGESEDKATQDDINYRSTGKTKTIHGLRCEQFIFKEEDDSNDYIEAWVTKDLDIDLGDLLKSANAISGEALPIGRIIEEGYFPIEANFYKDNTLKSIVKAIEVDETRTARAKVEVPSAVKVYNFQQYLFQRFSQSGKKQ